MGSVTSLKRHSDFDAAIELLVDGHELARELAMLRLALVGAVAEIKDYAGNNGNVPADYADALLEPVTEGLTRAAERAHRIMGALVTG